MVPHIEVEAVVSVGVAAKIGPEVLVAVGTRPELVVLVAAEPEVVVVVAVASASVEAKHPARRLKPPAAEAMQKGSQSPVSRLVLGPVVQTVLWTL